MSNKKKGLFIGLGSIGKRHLNLLLQIYFSPIHLKTFYRKTFNYSEGSLPITEKISNKILTLPMSLGFVNEDQDYIIDYIKNFFNK